MELTLEPTFSGYIRRAADRLQLVTACMSGTLHQIPRFPHEHELSHLARSGNIFVYSLPATGFGQWNDGKSWIHVGYENRLRVEREHHGPDALWKKTGSVPMRGVSHYIVSYYKVTDILDGTREGLSQSLKSQGIKCRPPP